MGTILDTIIAQKRAEILELKKQGFHFLQRVSDHRAFIKALHPRQGLAIIAEVKKASPSKGVIRHNFDPVAIAKTYERSGAHAVSVLTDQEFFQGSAQFLVDIRSSVACPVLRKDFIIDSLQVEQTAMLNADAMLLIGAALDDRQLNDLYQMTIELGIDPLVEVHTRRELERVMRLDPPLIGINNRDLATFKTDISVTLELLQEIPSGVTVVAESGIYNGEQALRLKEAGVHALLVGESLMLSDDVPALVKELSL